MIDRSRRRHKAMADLEKGIEMEADIGASDAEQIPVMARGEEKEIPISDLRGVPAATADGGVIAANMNPGKNKSLIRYWLIVTASVMILTNHIQSAPKYQLIPLEPMVIFMMFMFAIFFVFRTMKQT